MNKKVKLLDLFGNKWVTISVCAYEAGAILAKKDKLPTITELSIRHKWVGVAFTAALGWHFVKTSMEVASS